MRYDRHVADISLIVSDTNGQEISNTIQDGHCKYSDEQEMMNGREQKCSRSFLLCENHKNGDFRIFGSSNHFIRSPKVILSRQKEVKRILIQFVSEPNACRNSAIVQLGGQLICDNDEDFKNAANMAIIARHSLTTFELKK